MNSKSQSCKYCEKSNVDDRIANVCPSCVEWIKKTQDPSTETVRYKLDIVPDSLMPFMWIPVETRCGECKDLWVSIGKKCVKCENHDSLIDNTKRTLDQFIRKEVKKYKNDEKKHFQLSDVSGRDKVPPGTPIKRKRRNEDTSDMIKGSNPVKVDPSSHESLLDEFNAVVKNRKLDDDSLLYSKVI